MKRMAWLLIPVLVAGLAQPASAALPDIPPPNYVTARHEVTPIVQGLTLTHFERLYPHGWVNGWLLTADLSTPTLASDVITAPGVTEHEPLLDMAARAGAVAAINGDFFAMGGSGVALGTVVKSGQYLQSPQPSWPNGVTVGPDRIGRLATVALEGTVTTPYGTHPLTVVNTPVVPEGGLGLFTPLWTRDRPWAMGDAKEGREVLVRAGRVVAVYTRMSGEPVPQDGYILVGTGDAARFLDRLQPGDPVEVSYRPSPAVLWAIGGQNYLVRDGAVVAGLDNTSRRPRSAVGFSADGRRMYLLTIEGDSARSVGATLAEVAEFMRSFGAANALELDGGGSATMVARRPGEALTVLNLPASAQRAVANGIGLFAEKGSGRPQVLRIDGEARVFAGLSRTFAVTAFDEQYETVSAGPVQWGLKGPGVMAPDGRFTAVDAATGRPLAAGSRATVTAAAAGLTAEVQVRVLGPLARIEPQISGGLALLDEAGRTFTVAGYDAEGYKALIDPRDLALEYDPSLVRVEPQGGALRAVPVAPGAGYITVSVQGHRAVIPFVSGMRSTPVPALEQPGLWTFERHPAEVTGWVAPAEGRTGGVAVALYYTFSPAQGNRAAYLQAVSPVALPGRPERIGLWVKGDGQGAWLRAALQDAAGASYTVDLAPRVDWLGWRYVEAAVPSGVAYPVSLHRIYPVETDAARSYSGMLVFADLTVKTSLPMPEAPKAEPAGPDPILNPAAPAGAESWSFAVLGALPPAPEAALQAALEASPRFFLVGPGLREPVRQILVQLGAAAIPVYEMAPPARYLDAGGVRFILLGTGQGGLRATAFHQWEELDALLDLAARAEGIRQVVVVGGLSPLGFADAREGQLLQERLTAFEERSGKAAAYLSAGGGFPSVTRAEGIPYIQAGTPQAPVIFTVDPAPGNLWLRKGR